MQFVGDAVMAVFGAPFPQSDHADHAVAAAAGMHALQAEINAAWLEAGLPEFGLGLGLSTGEAAAALLGSVEHLEYTLVGDTVNLAQRLQQFAAAGETVISAATKRALTVPVPLTALPPQLVKGRETAVQPFKIGATGSAADAGLEPVNAPEQAETPEPAVIPEPAAPPAVDSTVTGKTAAEQTVTKNTSAQDTTTGHTAAEGRAADPPGTSTTEGTPGTPAAQDMPGTPASGNAAAGNAPAAAARKAEGNRKWMIWKSRNGTR